MSYSKCFPKSLFPLKTLFSYLKIFIKYCGGNMQSSSFNINVTLFKILRFKLRFLLSFTIFTRRTSAKTFIFICNMNFRSSYSTFDVDVTRYVEICFRKHISKYIFPKESVFLTLVNFSFQESHESVWFEKETKYKKWNFRLKK